ncbi:MAG: LamG domain-containing protein [Desulfobacterales bacterium]|nr:LamG domain-containing protein [Desulfobacterales bacterium]
MKKIMVIMTVLAFVFSGTAYADLNDGLVAYYPFNDNANDESGNGNDGIEHGDINYVEGIIGTASQFNGTDSYISVQDNGNLSLTEWTISVWVRVENFIDHQLILVGKDESSWRYNYALILANAIVRSQYEIASTDDDRTIFSPDEIPLNQWVHVVSTRNALTGEHKLYLDSTLVVEKIWNDTPVQNGADLLLGGNFITSPTKPLFDGLLDEVRIYNRPVSESEIQELYSLGQETDLQKGLVAHYEFEDNADDTSGEGNHGQEYGGVEYTNGVIGKAGKFDGVDDFIEIMPQSYVSAIGDFTISAWTYLTDWKEQNHPTAHDDRQYVFNGHGVSKTAVSDFTSPGFSVVLDYKTSSGVEELHNGINYSNTDSDLDQNTPINVKGNWHHIVFMRIDDTDYTYFDGEIIEPTYSINNKKNDLLDMQHYWFIGTYSGNNPNYNPIKNGFNYSFKGLIDDLRIYNRSLSESEIQELYNTENSDSFVSRQFPCYIPGNKSTVSLVAAPLTSVSAYAVEDTPPLGWEVSNISDSGTFDSVNNRVKFGPFFNNTTRTLTYDVIPPSDQTDNVVFVGTASADGVNTIIRGDSVVSECKNNHPADTDENFVISIGEVTAYGSAWKNGTTWSIPPNPVPIDYLTRAGAIWECGEKYKYDEDAGNCPLCWVNVKAKSKRRVYSKDSSAIIDMPEIYNPGESFTVQIIVTPSSDVTVYAVENEVPKGWAVSSPNKAGAYDAFNSKVKYGPFFDNQTRTLAYDITPPPDAEGTHTFTGTASFDGVNLEITGDRDISNEGTVTVTIPGDANQDGKLDLPDVIYILQILTNMRQ